ncbi:Dihydrouridine synthase [Paragonimus heterotremus]|uniref:Exocyst complex component 7 n=1 Tax=Paragonimus heterotremus TaxID=100268 RepID=A0A8J4WIS4_9TREM|nr:Dihydrouridine synthase [Paragonimus heterotremus]
MSISVHQIEHHLNELATLRKQFSLLSSQSIEKFGKIIDTAKVYQVKMDPLNKDMAQLNTQRKNVQACYEKLSQIQTYRKTAGEVESLIEQGPSHSLQSYLEVMKRLQEAFKFFHQNDIEDVELTRLQALYALGMNHLITEFSAMLKQTFRPVDVQRLLLMVEQKAPESSSKPKKSIDELPLLEEASDPLLNSLQFLVNWMQNGERNEISSGMRGIQGSRACLQRYHDYRREVVRFTLFKLRSFLKEREEQVVSAPARGKAQSSIGLPRARPKRLPGFVWDVNQRRQLNESETEELNSEHYAISLLAVVILMQNERRWLDRLQLTSSPGEAHISMDTIFKVSANELLNDGHGLIRLMQSAEKRAEYHMILSLLLVLKKLSLVGSELIEVLQGVDHILFGFNSLVYKLLNEVSSTLQKYVDFLGRLPEHLIMNRAVVPPDGTVHELTTNAFMFFENLLEFADVLSVAFHANEIGPQGNSNVIHFLYTNVQNYSQLGPLVGRFLIGSIRALIENLDHKSESYTDELVQLLFQMNNLHYVLKTIHRTDIHRYILSYNLEGIATINSILDDRRGRYSRAATVLLRLQISTEDYASGSLRRRASQFGAALASMLSPNLSHSSLKHLANMSTSVDGAGSIKCSFTLQIPNSHQLYRFNNSSGRNMDSKERAALKALWHDFNSGFSTLVKQHSTVSIPDRDLRECLERQLIADLVPPYRQFWERSSVLPFTTHRDKYMRFTVEQFEARLRQLFTSSGH